MTRDRRAEAVDSALALVCALPEPGRDGRRVDVATVIAQATLVRATETGIIATFANADNIAQRVFALALAERHCCAHFRYSVVLPPDHEPIELHVSTTGALVQPLQDLYLRLAELAGVGTSPTKNPASPHP
jgi:hypothetical protein